MASDVQVLDRSGELIERVRADFQVRRGDWLALQDISAAFQRAVILSEDQRFYTHAGVDWRGMAAAAWDTLVHERRRGASTLSMQRSEEHTSDLQSLMRISYAVFFLKKKKNTSPT